MWNVLKFSHWILLDGLGMVLSPFTTTNEESPWRWRSLSNRKNHSSIRSQMAFIKISNLTRNQDDYCVVNWTSGSMSHRKKIQWELDTKQNEKNGNGTMLIKWMKSNSTIMLLFDEKSRRNSRWAFIHELDELFNQHWYYFRSVFFCWWHNYHYSHFIQFMLFYNIKKTFSNDCC